jgi:parallel beta-helix repeat protein
MKHTRTTIVVAVAAGLVALPAAMASAATTTLYVAKTNCSNSNSGTSSSAPLCTISAAALKAKAGFTVSVASGTYNEMVTVAASGTATAPVVFTGSGATVTGGTNGFKLSSKAYVTIKGFTVTKTSAVGILVSGSNHITLDGNNVSSAGQPTSTNASKGISLSGTTASTVKNNVTHNNTDAGIGISSGSTGNTISNNTSYSNARGYTRAAAGIDLRNSGSNTVTGNTVYSNEDSGINVWTSSNNSTVASNYAHNNGDHGIDVHSTNGTTVSSNRVCSNYDSGIEMTGSLNTVLNGNHSVLNGINSARTSGQLRADSTSAPSTKANNDTLYQQSPLSSKTVFIDWSGTKYTTLAQFQAATGQELNGTVANVC